MGLFKPEEIKKYKRNSAINGRIELIQIDCVIESEYKDLIADLAIRDKIAYRAARKNMQIHSAVVLKMSGKFSGFMTYQVNHEAKEFCLLQSAMELDRKDKDIYSMMVQKIIDQKEKISCPTN